MPLRMMVSVTAPLFFCRVNTDHAHPARLHAG
jgi:hypothetical protein